jgi:hypothetical protein
VKNCVLVLGRISSHYEELFVKIKFSGPFSFHNANIYAKNQPLLGVLNFLYLHVLLFRPFVFDFIIFALFFLVQGHTIMLFLFLLV